MHPLSSGSSASGSRRGRLSGLLDTRRTIRATVVVCCLARDEAERAIVDATEAIEEEEEEDGA